MKDCNGSYADGTACDNCRRCFRERRAMAEADKPAPQPKPVPSKTVEVLNKLEAEDWQVKFEHACDRIFDMLLGDDGEAFLEAEKFLRIHAPGLQSRLEMERSN